MRTGTADLPLHHGRAPKWLFAKMAKLAGAIIETIVIEQGGHEFMRRVSDPFWFQAFGSVLGFDWHSSGLTTTVCGAMKEGTREISRELGLFFCGGKGGASRKTPLQIQEVANAISLDGDSLIHASKTSAKVDNSCVQDGYNLYHHLFIFTADGAWSVVQQGMNPDNRYARRYHWLSLDLRSYVNEPHAAVCCDRNQDALNMVAVESSGSRESVTEIARENPDKTIKEAEKILKMPRRHPVLALDISPKYFHKILLRTYEQSPRNFEELIGVSGVGPKTVRALALIGELLYGTRPSFRDPARYSFAHGGKDGFPYPVDRNTYNQSIAYLESAIKRSKIGESDKLKALRKITYM
ncbi:MAG: DUF763 domain-containing protein [candidate division WOR-3 bacterium]|nr:DUF763 domain-containing protein [candidate division WOR-3 bacterium]